MSDKTDKTERLARAILAIQGVFADGDMINHKSKKKEYSYAKVDDIFVEVRGALANEGLVPWQSAVFLDFRERKDYNGKVVGESIFSQSLHAILGPGETVPAEGEAESVFIEAPKFGPQSFAAIRTFAEKYYLRTKLLLPIGSELDDFDSVFYDQEKPQDDNDNKSKKSIRGTWTLSESGKFQEKGEWTKEYDRIVDLFKALRTEITKDPDPDTLDLAFLRKVMVINKEIIKELPQDAIDALEECIKPLGIPLLQ